MSKLLSRRGYHVILVARREERMKDLAESLDYGATVLAQDLSEPWAAQRLFDNCQERGLHIDVLINNAGFGRVEPHTEVDPDKVERMNNLNITCLASLCRLFGQEMKIRGEGCILNVGSTAGYLPIPFMANYAATKAFVASFTRALRAELRPHGIQVSLLNPGPTRTEFGENAQERGDFISGKPGVMEAREVAEYGITGLFADHAEIVPGPFNQALPFIARILPKSFIIRTVANWMRARIGEE